MFLGLRSNLFSGQAISDYQEIDADLSKLEKVFIY